MQFDRICLYSNILMKFLIIRIILIHTNIVKDNRIILLYLYLFAEISEISTNFLAFFSYSICVSLMREI